MYVEWDSLHQSALLVNSGLSRLQPNYKNKQQILILLINTNTLKTDYLRLTEAQNY